MIIKIQRPLITNSDKPMALVYNQDRSFQTRIPYSTVKDLFAVDDDKEEQPLKLYYEAEIVDTKLIIQYLEEAQDW